MVTHCSTDTQRELERIEATFRAGAAMCCSALFAALSAVLGIVLMIVSICMSIIDLSIGILTCLRGCLCMARLLLSLCKTVAEQKAHIAVIEGRAR